VRLGFVEVEADMYLRQFLRISINANASEGFGKAVTYVKNIDTYI
jgi:hypothetical protein